MALRNILPNLLPAILILYYNAPVSNANRPSRGIPFVLLLVVRMYAITTNKCILCFCHRIDVTRYTTEFFFFFSC